MKFEDRFEGRFHVFAHRTLVFGARPLPVPGEGHVLCASAALPFRLGDGSPAAPDEYMEAVSGWAGEGVAPDTMAPLPGAEVLVLGPVAPVVGDERDAELRCGDWRCRLRLRADPEAPGEPLRLGPEAAAWDEDDNPFGRGGPDDGQRPLIVLADDHSRPVWLGPTSQLHPARARLMGASAQVDSAGWPEDARPEALCESHEAFWADRLHPGDPLRIVGLGPRDVDIGLPAYRPNLASLRMPGERWRSEAVRIHAVLLLPAADLGAVIWRSRIALGADILGEKVTGLVFALEDIADPERDEQALAEIVERRWANPSEALDERPLLPRSLEGLAAPPAVDSPGFDERHEAAGEWVRKEMGIDDMRNPYGGEPEVARELAAEVEADENDGAGSAPDIGAVADIGGKALQAARARHKHAGFDAPELETLREPELRGDRLEREMDARLAAPWRSPRERMLLAGLKQAPADAGEDPESAMSRFSDVRLIAPEPALFWPALTPEEGERFGAAVLERFRAADPPGRYIDISGAVMAAGPGDGKVRIEGRAFEALLAEETVWRDVEFNGCAFRDSSFAKARFEHCAFLGCSFEDVNFAAAHTEETQFRDCAFTGQTLKSTVWLRVLIDRCEFASAAFTDAWIVQCVFENGRWEQVQATDTHLVEVVFRDMEFSDVVWSLVHAPHTRFERVRMFKFWGTGMGCPESEFESVEADTCGFLGGAYFNRTRFARTRFARTGFTKAIFLETVFGDDCAFVSCDLSSAAFIEARLPGLRFLACSMAGSVWGGRADAAGAWFLGCILRGVDFADTRLLDAVFADADLEGAVFDEKLAIGADFRGTGRASGGD